MNDKSILITAVIFLVLLLGLQQYIIRTTPKEDDVLLKKIESIQQKLDSIAELKDSVRMVIDSTHIKIVTNEKNYKEIRNTIITNNDSANNEWAKQYIKDYRERLSE